MRKTSFIWTMVAGIALVVLFSNFSKKKVYPCQRQETPVEFNEHQLVWDGEYRYDPKTELHYGISYDDKYLFVNMKTSNKTLQRKIMMSGLTLWLDTNGRGKEQLGLVFPLQHKVPDLQPKDRKQGALQKRKTKAEIEKFNLRYVKGMELMDRIGYDGTREPQSGRNVNDEGINAILHMDSTEFLYYLACIPLDYIFNDPRQYLTDPEKYFSFSFEIEGVDMPQQGQGGGRPSMGGQMGGGGSGGGRPSGGGPPSGGGGDIPDMSQMQEMMQPTKFTIKKASLGI